MPTRFSDRFGPGGFNRFIQHGVVYTNVHYRQAATLTGVGHATLFTGGNSTDHGIVGNDWYDQVSKSVVYCAGDTSHPVLIEGSDPSRGRSPRNLTTSTIGDELILAYGKSRVFSVSTKDRSAILSGGHLGKAFWYNSAKEHT